MPATESTALTKVQIAGAALLFFLVCGGIAGLVIGLSHGQGDPVDVEDCDSTQGACGDAPCNCTTAKCDRYFFNDRGEGCGLCQNTDGRPHCGGNERVRCDGNDRAGFLGQSCTCTCASNGQLKFSCDGGKDYAVFLNRCYCIEGWTLRVFPPWDSDC
jgi:hypothetical protein